MIQDGFHAALRRSIDELLETRANQVTRGFVADYADYKNNVGYIQALRDVVAMAEELEKKLYSNPLKGAA